MNLLNFGDLLEAHNYTVDLCYDGESGFDNAMSAIYDASAAAAEEYGLGYELIAGNDIAAFKKISEAMMAQGL